ncbi:MAG: 1,4-alpha-glucan branching protein GlgB, partial [Myxococcales bacterium]
MISDDDLHLFAEGTHHRLYERLGAHPGEHDGQHGVTFAVWAPHAREVSVIGEFNDWRPHATPMHPRGGGLWEVFVPGLGPGTRYKFRLGLGQSGSTRYVDKADPFAFHAEVAPRRASVVADLDYAWSDQAWMASRGPRSALTAPVSIYEVHLGSWRRGDGDRMLTYREIAHPLAEHALRLGFTHVELLPITEHPFYGSWGYQVTGYFAPTSRYGSPTDLMYLIDVLHQAGLAVILDWVPSHFPTDEHGLGYFDGTHLYEHADPRLGYHPDWNSFIFDYGRLEVRSFLLSSARFWLDRYHVDGIRVDAVASMLYLDYSRPAGAWVPNVHGGRENLEAIALLRSLNEEVYRSFPDVQVYAEESTSWPQVSRPLYVGGLGFGYKWDMGWMNDTLSYLARDPIFRAFAHNQLTFRPMYVTSENFVLPLSHDEVVHGKGSLLTKMPGDRWQQLANLRLLLAHQCSQPGKKLLFMGSEFGQEREWNHDRSLDWHLLEHHPEHQGIAHLVRDLNHLYTGQPALHEGDCTPDGFEWVDCSDASSSIVAFLRRGASTREIILVVLNHTPIRRDAYRVGVPYGGDWVELVNTDADNYGGSGVGNLGRVHAQRSTHHGRAWSLSLTIPPLAALFFKGVEPPTAEELARTAAELELDESLTSWPDTPAGTPR